MIDLRSDTVTIPSDEMRERMAAADVGDDVYGEDPSINTLQDYCANLFGKEKALFVPSGTMANQVSLNAHTQPGDEVICEYGSHIFNYEAGAPSVLSGIQLHPLHGNRGRLTADQIENAIRPSDVHAPSSRVIALENTHNRAGGVVFPLESIREIASLADSYNLAMHLDGARLMNAVVATGTTASEYASCFDSVTLCFSKGLGAPVGSIVAGSEEFIHKAHRYRKMYGGGMRQAGILAAAAQFALENNMKRLHEDHENAQKLAAGIAGVPGIEIDPELVETNIVIFSVKSERYNAQSFCEQLHRDDVLMNTISPNGIRAVTNLMIDREAVDTTINIFKKLLIE